MNLITLATKKTLKETERQFRYLRFFSSKNFSSGDVLEIIEGNKKSLALILKSENLKNFKQEIKKGELPPKKLKFSKTGENKDGKILETLNFSKVKKKLAKEKLNSKDENKYLKYFFPTKKKIKRKSEKIEIDKKIIKNENSTLSFSYLEKREKKYTSELQELVDTIRNYFNEKKVSGVGSFSYYAGFLHNLPKTEVWQIFSEAKELNSSTEIKKRFFWKKIGNLKRKK